MKLNILKKISLIGIFVAIIIFSYIFFTLNKINSEEQKNNFHKSYYTEPSHFEEGFERIKRQNLNIKKIEGIQGVIVNHHLLASHLIVKTLISINKEPSTVIIISPNHFNVGVKKIQTTKYFWQTPYGILKSDMVLIDKLSESVEGTPFLNYYSCTVLVH